MAKLTEAQREIAERIVREGKCELSRDSSPDYLAAAAYVFDNGLMFRRPHLGRQALTGNGRAGE